MNEPKQTPVRSAPLGSTTIASNSGGNANGVVMPTASTSAHYSGGQHAFLSPTKTDYLNKSPQALKNTNQKNQQFKSVQMISQQGNLINAPPGASCVVVQQVNSNNNHNLAFGSIADNQPPVSQAVYQQGGQTFVSPQRQGHNAGNSVSLGSGSGHVQMQSTQVPTRYTSLDARQVQMIQLNNNQYYQVGGQGQPLTLQHFVQQHSQQQFVSRNGVVFTNQGNQDGGRILQSIPSQVQIQNTVSPQNSSFHLTKTSLKNVRSINQLPTSNRRNDLLTQQTQVPAATSTTQFVPSSQATSLHQDSSPNVFTPPPKSKPRSRSSKTKPKVSPQAQVQQQVITQTQQVTNQSGQSTATIQQIALPVNSQSSNQNTLLVNHQGMHENVNAANHQMIQMQGTSMPQTQQPQQLQQQHHKQQPQVHHLQQQQPQLQTQQQQPQLQNQQQPQMQNQQQQQLQNTQQQQLQNTQLQNQQQPQMQNQQLQNQQQLQQHHQQQLLQQPQHHNPQQLQHHNPQQLQQQQQPQHHNQQQHHSHQMQHHQQLQHQQPQQRQQLQNQQRQGTQQSQRNQQSSGLQQPLQRQQQQQPQLSQLSQPSDYADHKQQVQVQQPVQRPSSAQSMPPPPLPSSIANSMPLPTTTNRGIQQSNSHNNNQNVHSLQHSSWPIEKVSMTINSLPTPPPVRRPPPGKQQTIPQSQQQKLSNSLQVHSVPHEVSPTKEELEALAMPPPPLPPPKSRTVVKPLVTPAAQVSAVVDPHERFTRELNCAFNSDEPLLSYRQMKMHFRNLIYENECYQSQLREYHQRLLKLERDNNYLMDRLLPYENISDSDGDESDSSTKTIEEKVVVQKTKKRPANRPSAVAPPKKKPAPNKTVANGVPPPSVPTPKPKPAPPPAAASCTPPRPPVSSEPTVVSAPTPSAAQQSSIKFIPPRSVSKIPSAPTLTKSLASIVAPIIKSGVSNNPALKQQVTKSSHNVSMRQGQPLLSSLIKGGTTVQSPLSKSSITITSPLAKTSLTIPSSPLAKNSVTIPPPRGPVTAIPTRFPRSESNVGQSSAQLMPPPSAIPRKLVFSTPSTPTNISSQQSATSLGATGSGEAVFLTPALPKHFNNSANVITKKTPVKAKVVISELPKLEGMKTSGLYSIRGPLTPGPNFIRTLTPTDPKKYVSTMRTMTTNPTPLSNATVTYTSLKPTPGTPSKVVIHQQSTAPPKRASTLPLAVITSMASPSKKSVDSGYRSQPFVSMPLQPQQHQLSMQRSLPPLHHTITAETSRSLPLVASTESSIPSSSNGPTPA